MSCPGPRQESKRAFLIQANGNTRAMAGKRGVGGGDPVRRINGVCAVPC